MDVIFLNSLYSLIPQRSVGPYLLKHYIAKAGYKSQVIDFCQEYTSEELFQIMGKFTKDSTLCVAVSSTFWFDETNYFYTYDGGIPPNLYGALKLYKQAYPGVKILLGGAHSSYMYKRLDPIDCVFISESEDTLVEYLDYIKKGSPKPPSIINPITRKETFRLPQVKRYSIENCDFQWTDEDCIIEMETLPLETSRGCIFKCKFCAYPHLGKKKFDYLKSNVVIKEHLINNHKKWGVTNYIMLDDTFNDSNFKVDGFLEITKSLPFSINYTAYIRADLVQKLDHATKLYDSGLRGAFFGIESIHPAASVVVGKGWSGKDGKTYVPELVNNIWNKNVVVTCGLIVGLPGETRQDLDETLNWVNTNDLNAVFFPLQVTNNLGDRPFSSEFERNAGDYGFKFDKDGRWYNDQWSRSSAMVAADELNKMRKFVATGAFNSTALKNLRFSDEFIMKTSRHNVIENNPDFFRRKNLFITAYKNKLMAIANQ